MRVHETDLRVAKTKEAIKKALFDLIDENGFEAITVKDLTAEAQINRGTFYLHYENIEDLIDEYYNDFIVKLSILFEEQEAKVQKEVGWYYPVVETVSPLMLNILIFIRENCKLFKFLWLTQENKYYKIKLKYIVKDILFHNENALIKKDDLLVPESYFTSYVISSFMGIVTQWIDRGCKESPEEIAEILSFLNYKGIFIASGAKTECQKGGGNYY